MDKPSTSRRLVDYSDSSDEENVALTPHVDLRVDYVRREPRFRSIFARMELQFHDLSPDTQPLPEIESALDEGFERVVEFVRSLANDATGAPEYAQITLEGRDFPGERIPFR